MSVHARARITIFGDDDLPGAFGPGTVRLLEGVEELHSLNKAAKSMGMAYSKAWRIVREAEAHMGRDLLIRDGARGSTLTTYGQQAVRSYRELESEVRELLDARVPDLFQ